MGNDETEVAHCDSCKSRRPGRYYGFHYGRYVSSEMYTHSAIHRYAILGSGKAFICEGCGRRRASWFVLTPNVTIILINVVYVLLLKLGLNVEFHPSLEVPVLGLVFLSLLISGATSSYYDASGTLLILAPLLCLGSFFMMIGASIDRVPVREWWIAILLCSVLSIAAAASGAFIFYGRFRYVLLEALAWRLNRKRLERLHGKLIGWTSMRYDNLKST
jgi:hypothetical protein